jgi:hypothetical protein
MFLVIMPGRMQALESEMPSTPSSTASPRTGDASSRQSKVEKIILVEKLGTAVATQLCLSATKTRNPEVKQIKSALGGDKC